MSREIVFVRSNLPSQIQHSLQKKRPSLGRPDDVILEDLTKKLTEVLKKLGLTPDNANNRARTFVQYGGVSLNKLTKINFTLLGAIMVMVIEHTTENVENNLLVRSPGGASITLEVFNRAYDQIYPRLDTALKNPLKKNGSIDVATVVQGRWSPARTSVIKEQRRADIMRYLFQFRNNVFVRR